MVLRFFLALFWVFSYGLLYRVQPPPPEGTPRRFENWWQWSPFYTALPWPAVEWNIFDGWLAMIPYQIIIYLLFFVLQFDRPRCRGRRNRSPRKMACVGLVCCLLLRGPLGAALTTLIVATVRWLALHHPLGTSWAVPTCWLVCLALMQAIFLLLATDTPQDPTRFAQITGLQALQAWAGSVSWPISWLLQEQGLVSWSYFRYDALRLISFTSDVNNANFLMLGNDFWSLLAYVLYPPLAVAGPIMGYREFMNQLDNPQPGWEARVVADDLLSERVLGKLILAVALYSFFPFPAWLNPETAKDKWQKAENWNNGEPMPAWKLFCCQFTSLHCIFQFEYCSLAAVWGLARWVALVDGIVPQIDMESWVWCPTSPTRLWKVWHASLHLWLQKYIYGPLGHRTCRVHSVIITFFFIAFWHDIRGFWDRPYWYLWALLNGILVILDKKTAEWLKDWPLKPTLRTVLEVIKGVIVVGLLMLANLPAFMHEQALPMVWAAWGEAMRDSWPWIGLLVLVFGLHALVNQRVVRERR